MQENREYILKLFKNADEKQRAIYLDILNDLLTTNSFVNGEKKIDVMDPLTPHSILIKQTWDKLTESLIEKVQDMWEINDMMAEMKDIFDLWFWDMEGEVGYTANHKVEEKFSMTEVWKNLVLLYPLMTDKYIKQINIERRLFLYNLESLGFLTPITPPKTEIFDIFSEMQEEIYDSENKALKEDISFEWDDVFKFALENAYKVWWKEDVDEEFSQLFNLQNVVNYYTIDKESIEYFFKKLWGKEENKLEYEYVGDELILRYNKWELRFWVWKSPYILLSMLLNKENEKWEVEFEDVVQKIYKPEKEYHQAYFTEEIWKIRNCISWINARFKKISNNEKLLRIEDPRIIKLK